LQTTPFLNEGDIFGLCREKELPNAKEMCHTQEIPLKKESGFSSRFLEHNEIG